MIREKRREAETAFPYEAVNDMILSIVGNSPVEMRGGSPGGEGYWHEKENQEKKTQLLRFFQLILKTRDLLSLHREALCEQRNLPAFASKFVKGPTM